MQTSQTPAPSDDTLLALASIGSTMAREALARRRDYLARMLACTPPGCHGIARVAMESLASFDADLAVHGLA